MATKSRSSKHRAAAKTAGEERRARHDARRRTHQTMAAAGGPAAANAAARSVAARFPPEVWAELDKLARIVADVEGVDFERALQRVKEEAGALLGRGASEFTRNAWTDVLASILALWALTHGPAAGEPAGASVTK